jgi:hypothetical protein
MCKNRVRLLLLDFLAFCFVHPAQALFNSTPQLLARDRRVVAQGAQLGLGDLRMDAATETAVGADQRVFAHGALDQIRHVVAGSADQWRATGLSSGTPRPRFTRRSKNFRAGRLGVPVPIRACRSRPSEQPLALNIRNR